MVAVLQEVLELGRSSLLICQLDDQVLWYFQLDDDWPERWSQFLEGFLRDCQTAQEKPDIRPRFDLYEIHLLFESSQSHRTANWHHLVSFSRHFGISADSRDSHPRVCGLLLHHRPDPNLVLDSINHAAQSDSLQQHLLQLYLRHSSRKLWRLTIYLRVAQWVLLRLLLLFVRAQHLYDHELFFEYAHRHHGLNLRK